jgi:hypothetical protein
MPIQELNGQGKIRQAEDIYKYYLVNIMYNRWDIPNDSSYDSLMQEFIYIPLHRLFHTTQYKCISCCILCSLIFYIYPAYIIMQASLLCMCLGGTVERSEGNGRNGDRRALASLMCCALLPLRPVFQSARRSGAESRTELTGNSKRQGWIQSRRQSRFPYWWYKSIYACIYTSSGQY